VLVCTPCPQLDDERPTRAVRERADVVPLLAGEEHPVARLQLLTEWREAADGPLAVGGAPEEQLAAAKLGLRREEHRYGQQRARVAVLGVGDGAAGGVSENTMSI